MSHVDTYNAFGAYTWNMLPGAVQINVKCWSATGGGQSGEAAAFNTGPIAGAQGANEGGYAEATYLASVLPGSVSVNIARAGAGGAAAVSAPAGSGPAGPNAGSNPSGGLTRFGPLASPYVSASNPSAGGQANIISVGSVNVAPAPIFSNTVNGNAAAVPGSSAPVNGVSNGKSNGTGGSGGYIDGSALAHVGGSSASGGAAAAPVNNASGPPAAAASSAGGGSIGATSFAGAITASAGGAGTQPGGGGGGGGAACADDAALNPSATSGAGGAGVDGLIIVTTFFASDFLPNPNFPFMLGRVPLISVPAIVMVNHTRPISLTGRYKA